MEPVAPPAPPSPAPPREAPPSGWKVYGVLLGITVLVLFTCLGLTLGYAYFLHVKSMR